MIDYNIEIVRRVVFDLMYANKTLEIERDLLADKVAEQAQRISELEPEEAAQQ